MYVGVVLFSAQNVRDRPLWGLKAINIGDVVLVVGFLLQGSI
jgi:hypothetical protein